MSNATVTEVLLIVVTGSLAALVSIRAELTRARGGKILAFVALFFLPSVTIWQGFSDQMERSKSTQFCLSCHTMEDYGRGLYMDNQRYKAAAHFENRRIPREEACYVCHQDYSMFGSLKDKWRGLHHVYREYIGTPPLPEEIKLYHPYSNRQCLHCHAGARSYLENDSHRKKPDTLRLVNADKLSCMASKCHDVIHDVEDVKNATFWKEPK